MQSRCDLYVVSTKGVDRKSFCNGAQHELLVLHSVCLKLMVFPEILKKTKVVRSQMTEMRLG